MTYLSQVMVLCREPENRHTIHAGSSCLLRQPNRGERLKQRKYRPAEHDDLLSGNRRGCAGAQTPDVGQGLSRTVPGPVLAFQNIRDLSPYFVAVVDGRRLWRAPFGKMRGARIKRANSRSIGEKIEEKPGSMRNL